MKLISHDIPVSLGTTEITIRHITDVHQGNVGFHERLFDRFVQEQKNDKNSYWVATGDLIDSDRPSTREKRRIMYSDRVDAFTQEDERSLAWMDKMVIPRYQLISKRCLGILDGDHYLMFSNGMTSGQYLALKTGIPYLGERMAYIGLLFKATNGQSCKYTILARHGTGGGSSSGSDISALERNNAGFIADLYLGGHTHKENIHPVPMLYPSQCFKFLKQKVVWFVRGGSFLMGFPSNGKTYVENKEYSPLCTGWAEIRLTLKRLREHNKAITIDESAARLRAS